jgi:hypothetical protein
MNTFLTTRGHPDDLPTYRRYGDREAVPPSYEDTNQSGSSSRSPSTTPPQVSFREVYYGVSSQILTSPCVQRVRYTSDTPCHARMLDDCNSAWMRSPSTSRSRRSSTSDITGSPSNLAAGASTTNRRIRPRSFSLTPTWSFTRGTNDYILDEDNQSFM